MALPYFYVHPDDTRKWVWKYFAPDPRTRKTRIVARCETPFETRADCDRAIEEMRELGLQGPTSEPQSISWTP